MRARKVDGTQRDIVAGLRDQGIEVWVIHEPCDLLTRFFCNRHQVFCWMPLESKPLIGKKKPKARVRTDQPKQNEFLNQTSVPIVTSWQTAIEAINLRHDVAVASSSTKMPTNAAGVI